MLCYSVSVHGYGTVIVRTTLVVEVCVVVGSAPNTSLSCRVMVTGLAVTKIVIVGLAVARTADEAGSSSSSEVSLPPGVATCFEGGLFFEGELA